MADKKSAIFLSNSSKSLIEAFYSSVTIDIKEYKHQGNLKEKRLM